eukprot:SAG25_NODE_21_length_22373_cov_13.904373_7_plen_54_part_00
MDAGRGIIMCVHIGVTMTSCATIYSIRRYLMRAGYRVLCDMLLTGRQILLGLS